ncbi:IPT/TIG domain-containing protein [Aquimarina sp. AU119]|uniref:IPT/TIG domain-containing protein n=1 Tax=Aquimarina sp. AU119 TaxID=2108528 RepID=UPI000D696E70|nr:IPT/TIG domain-containing protein [Aquimarina sp. AU119]
MKKIYLFTLLSILFFGCSSDDSSPDAQLNIPIIDDISTTNATAGDIITITGKNFDSNQTYIIKFNGTQGTVTEITATFLKAKVPEGATTGDITLTINTQTTVVGTITIDEEPQSPTIENISTDSAVVGDIITVNGTNFDPEETYIIKFNGIQGTITEITTTSLKVQVPEGATTGEITLTFNEKATVIGNIEILEVVIDYGSRLFAYKDGITPSQIVEIDKNTGEQISVIADIDHDNYLSDFIFDDAKNEIICNYTDNNITYLYKINVDNGQTTSTQSNPATGRYENWIIGRYNSPNFLFAYKDQITPSKIVQIDLESGNFVDDVTDIDHNNYLSDFNFDSDADEIICNYTDNNITYLYKINVNNGQTTSIQSNPTTGRYENWIMSANNRLFVYKDGVTPSQIIEIDKNTGNQISVIADIDHDNYLSDFVFDSSKNEIICNYTGNNITYLYKINVDTGKTTSIQSNPTTGRYENWIMSLVQ